MKDNRLENEFEEYFHGVNIPNDITADAKKSVKPKSTVLPKVVKFASIAASIVLVFAISLTVMFSANSKKSSGNMASGGSAPSSPDFGPSGGAGSEYPDYSDGDNERDPSAPDDSDPSAGESSGSASLKIYTDSDITENDETVSALSSLHSSLKFIEDFAAADGTGVENCKSAYMDGKLAFVKAQIAIPDANEQTAVYVEFTDKNVVYSELADYYDGDIHYYENVRYYLSKGTGGACRLLILQGGIKYYFEILSSDENAYKEYLKLIIK